MDKVIEEMKRIFEEVPYGIDHSLKVHENAKMILAGESLTKEEQELIEIVAVLHDIGAIEAQRKYGSMEGQYQEIEGPPIAKYILEKLMYSPSFIDRICYIIAHHHTPERIDGLDFQIQWEADLIESLPFLEVYKNKEALRNYIEENFKTVIGKELALKK